MRGLRGKAVLISGGSSGIGEATARRFLQEGARVYLGGLHPDHVTAAVQGLSEVGEVSGAAADVSQVAGVAALVKGAVSYTHLRAHETDSYLVCRLLLE